MGYFLDPQDFTKEIEDLPDFTELIDEVEIKTIADFPILGTLSPTDQPWEPFEYNMWTAVGKILRRAVLEWARQGYEGLRSKTIGPFSKAWWDKAGLLDKSIRKALRELVDMIVPVSGVGPQWSAPPTRSLGYLFDIGRGHGTLR